MLVDSGEWNVKDKAKAEAYVKAANYDGTPIVYLTNATTTGAFYKAAMAIIPAMESIGLKVELMAVDAGSHGALRKDPKTGHDIGCWEVQKNTENPVLHSTFVTGTQGWWSSPARDAAIEIMKTTPTGSPESVKAYEQYTQAVIDECPYILFGNGTGSEWTQANVVKDTTGQMNYYYWNTYFTENPRKK
jgi:ABC-type transport system substrate-binding protein